MPDTQLYIPESAGCAATAQARVITDKWAFSFTSEPPKGMALTIENSVLQLKDFSQPKLNGVAVDFMSGAAQYRKQHGGGRKEAIARAVIGKGPAQGHVVDATPGLGRDAFVLASLGMAVTMIERSAVVAALLEDGLARLNAAAPELSGRFSLVHGNSAELMQYWNGEDVDVVYLDPMFPHRKKSAQVKKEMQLFQQLLGHDEDANLLLAPACKLAGKRVVVKRPDTAPELGSRSPTMTIKSKKHRFDVYLTKNQGDADD